MVSITEATLTGYVGKKTFKAGCGDQKNIHIEGYTAGAQTEILKWGVVLLS
jgi:hypothetical protein